MAKKTTKSATKKVAAKKKVAVKKTAPIPVAPAKKVAVKKAPAKKAAKKKAAKKTVAAPKKVLETTIIARIDVGHGNDLYIRGEGAGLNWDQGVQMENISASEWSFKTTSAKTGIVFKFLINDETWSDGENYSVSAGGTSISTPSF